MKINIALYGNDTSFSPQMTQIKDFILQNLGGWLSWTAVNKVEVAKSKQGFNASNLAWDGADDVPAVIKELRPYVLINIVKALMDVCNIKSLDVELTEEELDSRTAFYNNLFASETTKQETQTTKQVTNDTTEPS